ncbi:MAG: glycosyltransferase family 4 protein [Verrucomicrobia bacterium]|nr:glycosyltransferase family 4 protein [Verrucomicrobiota bacterium]
MLGIRGFPGSLGGAENFSQQVATRLAKRGHEVTVYCRRYVLDEWAKPDVETPGWRGHLRTYRGVTLKLLPTVRSKHLDNILHTVLATTDSFGKTFDVIHYHSMGPCLLTPLPYFLRRARVVATAHGLDWTRAKWGGMAKRIIQAGELCSAHFSHVTTTVSKGLARHYRERYGKQHVYYVPTGVEMNAPRRLDQARRWGLEPERYLLFLSRITPEKGAHYLIEAYRRVRPPMKLIIAGGTMFEQSYTDRLQRMVREAGLADQIIFTGFVTDEEMEELFSNAYLYVLPSEIEGLPHSLLQALSYGRCVLASDIDSCREALGECGYTFRSTDVDDLSRELARLVEDPNLVRAEKDKGIARVKQEYDWETVTDRFVELYSMPLM